MSTDNDEVSKDVPEVPFYLVKKQMFSRVKYPGRNDLEPPFDNVRIMDGKDEPLPVPLFITTRTYLYQSSLLSKAFRNLEKLFKRTN